MLTGLDPFYRIVFVTLDNIKCLEVQPEFIQDSPREMGAGPKVYSGAGAEVIGTSVANTYSTHIYVLCLSVPLCALTLQWDSVTTLRLKLLTTSGYPQVGKIPNLAITIPRPEWYGTSIYIPLHTLTTLMYCNHSIYLLASREQKSALERTQVVRFRNVNALKSLVLSFSLLSLGLTAPGALENKMELLRYIAASCRVVS